MTQVHVLFVADPGTSFRAITSMLDERNVPITLNSGTFDALYIGNAVASQLRLN